MEHSFNFRVARATDSDRIWEIIQQAKAQMRRENKQQWDESYPAMEHIMADLSSGYAYVLCADETIVAYAAVVFDGEPTYNSIDGKWLSDLPYVVVHRLAVCDEMKHKGIAVIVMREIERLSVYKGVHSFKVDTNFDNLGMQKVLAKCGFDYCGEIFFQGDSRMAYEKLI